MFCSLFVTLELMSFNISRKDILFKSRRLGFIQSEKKNGNLSEETMSSVCGSSSGEEINNNECKKSPLAAAQSNHCNFNSVVEKSERDVLDAVEGMTLFKQALISQKNHQHGQSSTKTASPRHRTCRKRIHSASSIETSQNFEPSTSNPNSKIRLESMEAMEIQMKRRLWDLKKRYQQKQNELSRLQRKQRHKKQKSKSKEKSKKKENESKKAEENAIKLEPAPPSPQKNCLISSPQEVVVEKLEPIIKDSTAAVEDDCHPSGSKRRRKRTNPKKVSQQSSDSNNKQTQPSKDSINVSPPSSNLVAPVLTSADLVKGLEILMLQEDKVFSAGTLTLIHPPDLYGVLLEGDRHRNRPIILCQEEVLSKCIPNLKVKDNNVDVNTRIVAYWSKKMHCLYPGTVESDADNGQINVDFDDGDSATISLAQVRLLPEDFPPCKRKSPIQPENGRRHQPRVIPLPARIPIVENNKKITTKVQKPEQSCWRWKERSEVPQSNGIATKTFYKSATKDHFVISCGDCAVFLSSGRPKLPYIGLIESMWESWAKTMVVRVRWFYHPEEITGVRRQHGKNALYKSTHIDENDVQTISHICYVLSYDEYKRRRRKASSKRQFYYCAGTYDPTSGQITHEFHEKQDLG